MSPPTGSFAWIVVGFALTYGNYLSSLTRA